jgi:hypothetical protein
MNHQQHERKSPFEFKGVGRNGPSSKISVKCLGKMCNGEYFESESKYIRLCPRCTKHAAGLQSSIGLG